MDDLGEPEHEFSQAELDRLAAQVSLLLEQAAEKIFGEAQAAEEGAARRQKQVNSAKAAQPAEVP